jgi:hypothetical protein
MSRRPPVVILLGMLLANSFWQATGTASFTVQFPNFLKKRAMVDGLLFIAATEIQPTLLPHAARSNAREWTRNEGPPRCSAPAS